MDNDLMARRLRPPSEPPRPQNEHAQAAPDESPWAAGTDLREEIPWDRPAPEQWPPSDDAARAAQHEPAPHEAAQGDVPEHQSTQEDPVQHRSPVREAAYQPRREAPFREIGGTEHERANGRPTTWSDFTSPWDEPAPTPQPAEPEAVAWLEPDERPQPDRAEDSIAPVQHPSEPPAQPEAAAQPETDVFVAGRAPWDAPEPFDIDEASQIDDRPAEMLAAYDQPQRWAGPSRATRSAAPAPASAPPAQAPREPARREPPADPYDAFAPVLDDVSKPTAPSWLAWDATGSAPTATGARPSQPRPPAGLQSTNGPTPPEDLFAPPEPAAAHEGSPSASGPAASAGQPVVLRIELAIVDGVPQLRTVDRAEPAAHQGAGDAQAEPALKEVPFTPRHPEFEPRTHAKGNGAPGGHEAADRTAIQPEAQAVPGPGLEPDPERQADTTSHDAAWLSPADQVPNTALDPWAPLEANPTSAWRLEPAPPDPLAALPAAPVTVETMLVPDSEPYAPRQFAPVPAPAPVAVPAVAPAAASLQPAAQPVAQQPDLWFLSSEPQTLPIEQPDAETSREPSSMMTAALTVIMAVVVIGLLLAFLWLMTSLPILR